MEGNPHNFDINSDPHIQNEQEMVNNIKSDTYESMKEVIEQRKESALRIYNEEIARINTLSSDRLKERSLQQTQKVYDDEIDSCNQLLEKLSKEHNIS